MNTVSFNPSDAKPIRELAVGDIVIGHDHYLGDASRRDAFMIVQVECESGRVARYAAINLINGLTWDFPALSIDRCVQGIAIARVIRNGSITIVD